MLICAMEATGVANAANMDKDEITNRKRRMLIPPSPSLAFVPTRSRRNDATLRHNRAFLRQVRARAVLEIEELPRDVEWLLAGGQGIPAGGAASIRPCPGTA